MENLQNNNKVNYADRIEFPTGAVLLSLDRLHLVHTKSKII